MDWQVEEGSGKERIGRRGEAWPVRVWRGEAGGARLVLVWMGLARYGRQGKARHGEVRHG